MRAPIALKLLSFDSSFPFITIIHLRQLSNHSPLTTCLQKKEEQARKKAERRRLMQQQMASPKKRKFSLDSSTGIEV